MGRVCSDTSYKWTRYEFKIVYVLSLRMYDWKLLHITRRIGSVLLV